MLASSGLDDEPFQTAEYKMCSSYFILILFWNTILNDFHPDTDLGPALIRSIGPDKETWGLNGSKTRKRLRNSVFWRAGLWLIRKGLGHASYLTGYLELIQKTLAESEEVHHRDKLLSLAFTEQRTIWTLNKSLFAESLWLLGFCISSFLGMSYVVHLMVTEMRMYGMLQSDIFSYRCIFYIAVSFLWNFFISKEASTAERRYRKERWSENYMHMGAFSTRTHSLLPLSSSPPLLPPFKCDKKGSWPALHFLPLTPPPPPHWIMDSFWQPRQKSRMASILETVSMIAEFGQQQWSYTNFRLSDRTLRSRDRNFEFSQEIVRICVAAKNLDTRVNFGTSGLYNQPVQYGRDDAHKAEQLELWSHLGSTCLRGSTSTRIWTRALQPDQEEVSSWRFRRARIVSRRQTFPPIFLLGAEVFARRGVSCSDF